MAVKCGVCTQKKVQRSCPALGAGICSLCCATKRQKEIDCPPSCVHLGTAVALQHEKEIVRTIAETFPSQEHDVFRIPEVVAFAFPIEKAFVDHLYADKGVNDLAIRDALWKVYHFFTGETDLLSPATPVEKVVFDACVEASAKNPDLSAETKAKAIVRILRAIQKTSGGALGPRGYLEFIRGMFAGKMKSADLF